MPNLSILVVDDDPLARRVMRQHLEGHRVAEADDLAAAKRRLAAEKYDVCFVDLKLGDGDDCSGLDVIPLAVKRGSYTVVMSAHDSEAVVEKAYSLGCHDFYSKGNEGANVESLLSRFLRQREKPRPDDLFKESFVTLDPETRSTVSEAVHFAASDLPLLILGPSGTGKTSLARLIHDHSGRPGQFVAINCASYTEDLLEAELFGYRKGAFTGAHEPRQGKLLLADQGTLFLDEVGSMSVKMQTKLLKALEERSFYPLGSDKAEFSSFRVISATLEDLQSLIKAGRMRFDFFQRIHGLTIQLKPLASRTGDVFPLLEHFMRGGRRVSFSEEAKQALLRYDWPGNIRELKRFVELLAAGSEGRASAETVNRLLASARTAEDVGDFATEEQYQFALQRGLPEAVDRFVDRLIARSLQANEGLKTKVLSDLKISTRLLYSSLKRLNAGGPRGS